MMTTHDIMDAIRYFNEGPDFTQIHVYLCRKRRKRVDECELRRKIDIAIAADLIMEQEGKFYLKDSSGLGVPQLS